MHGDLTINPKFQELLPTLAQQEYNELEKSILAEGCRDAVLVWRNTIVDGHNRAEICAKHDIQYRVNEMPFVSEDEALEWILVNQLGRRNLTGNQKTLFIALLYELRKKKVGGTGANQFTPKSNGADLHLSQDVAAEDAQETIEESNSRSQKPPAKTAEKVAEQVGVSPRTVYEAAKVGKALETLPAEDKENFAAGKLSQKAVIEKAKEVTAPAPAAASPDTSKDDFTRAAKRHATIFLKIFGDYNNALINASREFRSHGQKFHEHAERLDAFHQGHPQTLLMLDTEAGMLKKLSICPKCKGGKCARCSQKGYVLGEDYNDILREMGVKK